MRTQKPIIMNDFLLFYSDETGSYSLELRVDGEMVDFIRITDSAAKRLINKKVYVRIL